MNSKKIQNIIFSSLFVLSIFSSVYLNLHVQPEQSTLAELTTTANDTSEELMADIDAFQNFIQNLVKSNRFKIDVSTNP